MEPKVVAQAATSRADRVPSIPCAAEEGHVRERSEGGSAKRAALVAISGVLASGPLCAQVPAKWTDRVAAAVSVDDIALAIAADASGRVAWSGWSVLPGGERDVLTACYDGGGVRLWTNETGSSANEDDFPTDLAFSAAGQLYVTGFTGNFAGGGGRCFTMKLDTGGVTQWWREAVAPGDFESIGNAIAVGPTGLVHAAGRTSSSTSRALVTTYDAQGAVVWDAVYSGGGALNDATDVATDSAGAVYVLVRASFAGASNDFVVVKYDLGGAHQWTARYGHTGGADDFPRKLIVAGDGSSFATGHTRLAATYDALTVAFDAAGAFRWSDTHAGLSALGDSGGAIAFDGAGGVYVAGHSDGYNSAAACDWFLRRFDANGATLWTRRYDGPAAGRDDFGGLAVDGSGTAHLAGTSATASGDAATIAAFGRDGQLRWLDVHGEPSGESTYSYAVAVDSLDRCIAAGGVAATDFDGFTVGYANPCASFRTYCTAGVSGAGCVASMGATPSANGSWLLRADSVEGQRQGLIFYGVSGELALPWGATSSFFCVKPPTMRTPLMSSGGAPSACDGELTLDFGAFVAANPQALGAPFTGGEVVQAQAWYRDPPNAKSTSLSDAIEFVYCP